MCFFLILCFQDLIPISHEVSIPYEYHRYIIGQKGREIRTLMEDHNLNIAIPPPDKKVCSKASAVEPMGS